MLVVVVVRACVTVLAVSVATKTSRIAPNARALGCTVPPNGTAATAPVDGRMEVWMV